MKKMKKHESPCLLRLSYLYESDYGFCTEEHFQHCLTPALRSNTVPLWSPGSHRFR
jgi:hypothetical protein